MEYDGIIGNDFLLQRKCVIDYQSNLLSLECFTETENSIVLPARSEKIIHIKTSFKGEGLCGRKEIVPGVFMGNTLVNSHHGEITIAIINTTEKVIQLLNKEIKPEIENLNDYSILTPSYERDPIADRLSKLNSVLKLDHCNNEENYSISEICREFNDIFYLEGDHLTHTDAVKHTILTDPCKPPINVRPYRLPHVHREEIDKQVQGMLNDDIIRHSKSPWNAPILIVPKKADSTGAKLGE